MIGRRGDLLWIRRNSRGSARMVNRKALMQIDGHSEQMDA